MTLLANGKKRCSRKINLGRDSQSVALPFAVPPSPGDVGEKIEIRAWRNHGDISFTSCRLNLLA